MDSEVALELSRLSMRCSLMEEIVARVYISELQTTATKSHAEAQQMAASNIGTYANEIEHQMLGGVGAWQKFPHPARVMAVGEFREQVEYLKALMFRL